MQFADAYIELIEMFPCANKFELHRREGEIIRERVCVNRYVPCRPDEENKEIKKQYYEDNKEKIKQYREDHTKERKQYNKQYNQDHKVESKQYYESKKNMRKCSCGVKYNDGKTSQRNQHYGTKHHIKFVQDFYERLHQLLVPVE